MKVADLKAIWQTPHFKLRRNLDFKIYAKPFCNLCKIIFRATPKRNFQIYNIRTQEKAWKIKKNGRFLYLPLVLVILTSQLTNKKIKGMSLNHPFYFSSALPH